MNPIVFETSLYDLIFPWFTQFTQSIPLKIISIFPAEEYSGIFLAIEKASKKTDAVTFHAKNMANTLESRSLVTFWSDKYGMSWEDIYIYVYIFHYIYKYKYIYIIIFIIMIDYIEYAQFQPFRCGQKKTT